MPPLLNLHDEIDLSTRLGDRIPNGVLRPYAPGEGERLERIALGEKLPGDAERVRPPDRTYNCFGLVFAARRVFVHPEHFALLKSGDELRPVADRDVQEGDIVVWQRNGIAVHAGIVIRIDVVGSVRLPTILSKWGQFGEFRHAASHVPVPYRGVTTYWREDDPRT